MVEAEALGQQGNPFTQAEPTVEAPRVPVGRESASTSAWQSAPVPDGLAIHLSRDFEEAKGCNVEPF